MQSEKSNFGIFIGAALLDMLFVGLVAQQFYSYWTAGFNDRIYLKLFVNVQFALVVLQGVFMWHLIFKVFVDFYGMAPPPSALWSGPANSLCQLFIIILANIFLVARIHGLTKSFVKTLTPMFFSVIAFVFGIVTVTVSSWTEYSQSYRYYTSVIWYSSQTMAECLISFFLVRALLKARSGMQRSDTVVRYLIRNVVQIAALATIWSIAALVSWFWLKRTVLFSIFDITSGTVYTHAIFDTLITRNQLRDRMASGGSAHVDLGYGSSQSRSRSSGRTPPVIVSNLSSPPQNNSSFEPRIDLANKSDIIELGKVSAGKPGIPYEF